MESIVYNQKGKEVSTVKLPDGIFGLPWNADLVHQVASVLQANLRTPVAHAKGRGEVRGGGKKPWRQKGTGRARHGSSRSPIWVGGGVTHGPNKEKVFARKISRGMKNKALFTVLSQKMKEGEVIFVDSLSIPEAKAKEARGVIKSFSEIKGFEYLATKKKNAFHVATPKKDKMIERSFANFPMAKTGEIRNLNLLDILNSKCLVVVSPKEAIAFLEAKNK